MGLPEAVGCLGASERENACVCFDPRSVREEPGATDYAGGSPGGPIAQVLTAG